MSGSRWEQVLIAAVLARTFDLNTMSKADAAFSCAAPF